MSGLPNLDYTVAVALRPVASDRRVRRRHRYLFARQLVNERLQEAKARAAGRNRARDGPIATGLGEIFMYTVDAEPARGERRRHSGNADRAANLQDWVDKPAAAAGSRRHRSEHHRRVRQAFHVTPNPAKLLAYDLVSTTCRKRSRRATGTSARATSSTTASSSSCARRTGHELDEIEQIIVARRDNVPIRRHRCRAKSCRRGTANWRGHTEMARKRARHGGDAIGREQSHGIRTCRREALRDQRIAAAGHHLQTPCTTARAGRKTIATVAEEPPGWRGAGDRSCSSAPEATSAPALIAALVDPAVDALH